MRIGTTPTQVFEIEEIGKDIPINEIKEVKITYKQREKIIVEKHKEDCVIETGKITTRLSQEETFKFDSTKTVSIQLRLLTDNGDCLSTDVMTETLGACLDDEVLR